MWPGYRMHHVSKLSILQWVVDPVRFLSKGRNTPFAGHTLSARVLGTWMAGVRTFDALEAARA